jgi:hypothetical protein
MTHGMLNLEVGAMRYRIPKANPYKYIKAVI